MAVLYHIKARKLFECDEGILPKILWLQKDKNEARGNCIKRN